MKYVYASRSGNVEELVHVLGLEAMKIKDGTVIPSVERAGSFQKCMVFL